MITIKAERIKTLREQRSISQAKLASLSQVGKRQIQRLEQQEGDIDIREETLKRLCKGLRVDRDVLTGEKPLPSTDLPKERGVSSERNIKLNPQIQLQFDLIQKVYGASFEDVVNIAPILFTLIAERSLDWREKQQQKKLKQVTDLLELSRNFPQLGKTIGAPSEEWEDYLSGYGSKEASSIKSKDVFGDQLLEDADPWWENPLVQYLKEELSHSSWKGKVDPVEMEGAPMGVCDYIEGFHVPVMKVLDSELERITGFVPDAMFALQMGRVRIEDIPPELQGSEKTFQRAQWITQQLCAVQTEE